MNKVITIPQDDILYLKMLAVKENKSFKAMVETLLEEAITNRKKKQSKK